MKGGLRRSLVSAIVTAIGALLLALLLLEDPLVEYRLGQIASEALGDATEVATARLERGDDPERVAEEVGAQHGCRITILDDNQRVIADSGFDGEQLRDAPVVDPALELHLEGREAPVMYDGFYVVFAGDSQIVQAMTPAGPGARVRTTVRELIAISGIMAALVAVFLTFVLGRTLVEPAQELTRVADALATGDLSARTGWTDRDDELGAIGRALDRMADQTKARVTEASNEQARLRTILDSMTESMFVTDSLARIQLTNAALSALVEGDPTGKTPLEALRSPQLHEAVREARRADEPSVSDIELMVGGEVRYIRAYVAPIEASAGVVALLHDVTQLKLANIIRSDFVANASHELRTPLTAIRGFAETLRDGALDDPDTAKRYIQVILKHAKRLEALAKDLTALSRTESVDQPFPIEEINAEIVVREVVDGLAPIVEEHQKTLDLQIESSNPRVLANGRALDQVTLNLIDNALKYGATHVRVRLYDDGEHVVLSVHNDGATIPPEHLNRIFERFYRVDPGRSRDVGGTGLGLAIVKHLCSQMQGDITVESPPDEGVTFTVRLPRAQQEPDAVRSSA